MSTGLKEQLAEMIAQARLDWIARWGDDTIGTASMYEYIAERLASAFQQVGWYRSTLAHGREVRPYIGFGKPTGRGFERVYRLARP